MRQAAPALASTRFQIIRLLGEGGMGVVYEALDRERNVRVALKTLRRFTPEGLARFKREFRAIEGIHHPNLVHLGELFSRGDEWFFTMDLVEGVDLLDYVRPWHRELRSDAGAASGLVTTAHRRLAETATAPAGPTPLFGTSAAPPEPEPATFDEARLRSAFSQLAHGLMALHEAGCVHRDVKPSNVRVSDEDHLVLLDFGIVRESETQSEAGITGTPAYMAPEQVISGNVTAAADWYSVGVVLYEALTGRLPFEGSHALVLQRKQDSLPPVPGSLARDLPADLTQLCLDLLCPDPQSRPSGSDILERIGGSAGSGTRAIAPSPSWISDISPLVGRHEELRALREAFDASDGKPLTTIVYGDSGIGKTLLVREFTARLATGERQDLVILAGRCREREEIPYKALDDVVDRLARRLTRMPEIKVAPLVPVHIGALMRVFPVLRRVRALAREARGDVDALEPRELRRRAFVALRDLFVRLARHARVVIVVDDLHWADADSFALLDDLLHPPDAPPLFFVATARTPAEGAGPQGEPVALVTAIPGDLRLLHVEPLPIGDAKTLAARLIASSGTPDEVLAETIAAEGGGHPLFIHEMARHAAGGRAMGALKLDDALWARVEELDLPTRRLLAITAVVGMPMPQEVAADAAKLEAAELLTCIGVLRAAHLVRTSGTHRDDTIEPYHDRVRESVVLHLGDNDRRTYHRQIAIAFERAGSVDAEALAVHWREAGDLTRAGEHTAKAADHASASLAFDRAARLYRLAAELRPADARALRLKLAEALTNAGRYAEAGRVRVALATDAEPIEAIDLRRRAAEQFMCCGHFDEGIALLREALAALSIRVTLSRTALLLALVFFRIVVRIRGVGFRARAPSSLDRRQLVRIDALGSASRGFGMTDHFRGAYFQTRNLLLSLRAGDPARIVYALSMEIGYLSSAGGAAARTERFLRAAQSIAETLGTSEAFGMVSAAAGFRSYFAYDWKGAREHFLRAESLFRQRCLGMTYELNTVRFMLYQALLALGEFGELAELARPVLREVDELGDHYSGVNLRATLAFVGLAGDDPAGASAELNEAEQRLSRSGFHLQHHCCLVSRVEIDLYRGEYVSAFTRVDSAWPALRRSMLLSVAAVRIIAVNAHARAAVAAASATSAHRDELLAVAESDARRLAREHARCADGFARMVRAAIGTMRGDRATALENLRAAETSFTAADTQLYAAAARYRRGELLGGHEGARLILDAARWMATQRIVDARKMTGVLAPGFPESARSD